jgi:hypothetical protein
MLNQSTQTKLTMHSAQMNQEYSPLLRLPAELRDKIYNHVLGVSYIELCRLYPCFVCRQIAPDSLDPVWHFKGHLPFLSTCWQIYTEAKLLPFILNPILGYASDMALFLHPAFKQWQLRAITELQIVVRRDQLFSTSKSMSLLHVPESYLGIVLSRLGGLQGLKRVCVLLVGLRVREWSDVKQSLLEGCRSSLDKADVDFEVLLKRPLENPFYVF